MKYSELISYIKKSNQPNKEQIKAKIINQTKKKSINLLTVICICVLCLSLISCSIVYMFQNIPLGKDNDVPAHLMQISPLLSVKPTISKNNVISTDTDFQVTTRKSVSKNEFKDLFILSPQTEYNVTKKSGNTFIVEFNSPLSPDTVYTVKSVSNMSSKGET